MTGAQHQAIRPLTNTAYYQNLCKIDDQDKRWAPYLDNKPCYNGITTRFNGKNLAVQMIYKKAQSHGYQNINEI